MVLFGEAGVLGGRGGGAGGGNAHVWILFYFLSRSGAKRLWCYRQLLGSRLSVSRRNRRFFTQFRNIFLLILIGGVRCGTLLLSLDETFLSTCCLLVRVWTCHLLVRVGTWDFSSSFLFFYLERDVGDRPTSHVVVEVEVKALTDPVVSN